MIVKRSLFTVSMCLCVLLCDVNLFENKPSISSKSYLLPKSCFGSPIRRDSSSSDPPQTPAPPCASEAIHPLPAASARSKAPRFSSPAFESAQESPHHSSSPSDGSSCSPAFAEEAPWTPEPPPAYESPVCAPCCTHQTRRCVFAPPRDRDKRDALSSTEQANTAMERA